MDRLVHDHLNKTWCPLLRPKQTLYWIDANVANWGDCVEKLGLASVVKMGFSMSVEAGDTAMIGERTVMQESLFYGFSLGDHVSGDHLLRSIDRFVDLSNIRDHLKQFYSSTGRHSIDPELMI